MSLDRFLSLQVTLIVYLAVAGASWSTVWVAPEGGECQGRSPCRNLQDLWHQETVTDILGSSFRFGASNISESNTTWVFLPGVHRFPTETGIIFPGVDNLVLTGDELCARKKDKCTIKCNYMCFFLFVDSRNITIQYLNVVHSNNSSLDCPSYHLKMPDSNSSSCNYVEVWKKYLTGECNQLSFTLTITSWTFIEVRDVHIYSLHLEGNDSQMAVHNPQRKFEIIGSQFSQLPTATDCIFNKPSLSIIISDFPVKAPERLDIQVSGCTFEADHYLPAFKTESIINKFCNHHAVLLKTTTVLKMNMAVNHVKRVRVTIQNCTFLRASGVDVLLSDSAFLQAMVAIVNSFFDGLANCHSLRGWEFEQLEVSGVTIEVKRGHTFCTSTKTLFSVLVSGNAFQNLTSIEGSGVNLRTVYLEHLQHTENLCNCKVPIVIANNMFISNWGIKYGSIVDAAHTWQNGSGISTDCGQRPFTNPALVMRNNSFFYNKAEFSKCLELTIVSRDHVHIYARRWNTVKECNARGPGRGIIHLRGYKQPYFVVLVNNSIHNNTAMGLHMIDSQVLFNGSNILANNHASYGGGIFIDARSQMLLMNGTRLHLLSNTAVFTGGGIFVSTDIRSDLSKHLLSNDSFFDLVTTDGQLARNITSAAHLNMTVTLSDNRATVSGNSLFVSKMSPYIHTGILQTASREFEVFHKVFHLPSYTNEKEVSSVPKKICSCNSSGPVNCSLAEQLTIQVFPGQSLNLWLTIVGEANVILSGDVTLSISTVSYRSYAQYGLSDALVWNHIKRFTNACNRVTITEESMAKILAGKYYILLSLPILDNTPLEGMKVTLGTSMNITVLDHCPHGYSIVISSSGQRCECHRVIQDKHITCHFSTLSFGLPQQYWIGVGSDNTSLLFSDHCLPAYCRDVYKSKEVFLSNLTQQCLHGRVGTLCGECPEGQSVMLGSYHCMTCPNYGILVAVVYLVAGPLVIVFICFFNWTVSARSSNGLLLYLNIISINSDLLLSSNSFAFVVISWLNFQVGIEMCFFDGMDEFAKIVLSFAFPLYLISLVALIVMVSKCINMHKINKLIGPRITPVLATVIFLSYTMLADSVLKSLLFARLCSTDGGCTLVWQLDGSLKYFRSPKHIILGCIALTILFVLLIPITLIAVIGDLFRRCISNRWYMNFLDTFHSSYRFRWGFWMGVRLVVRIVLLLLKVTVKPEVVWLVTACFSLSLAAVQSVLKPFRHLRFDRFTHRLVDQWCSSDENGRTVANYLDISFLVNLTSLFLCISYLPDSAEVFISLSLCVALIEMFLILAYHLVEYSPVWPPLLRATTRMVERVRVFWQNLRPSEEQCEPTDNHQLLGLPLVLRAADCTDESYESSLETSEEEVEQNAVAH